MHREADQSVVILESFVAAGVPILHLGLGVFIHSHRLMNSLIYHFILSNTFPRLS